MKKAVAYVRVSTENQTREDKYGLPAQKEDIRKYAEKEGIEIVSWYADEGISGATLERQSLQEMIEASKEKSFSMILVAKMDRIARDLFVSLFVEKELLLSGVEIISVSEPVSGKDPMNVAFRQMMGVFAELEKNMITMRMSSGRKQKARGGGYAGGQAAIGYQASKGEKMLNIDQEKALTVKRAFELKEEDPERSLQDIADHLNVEGHTTAQGKQFKRMQVKRILDRKDLYSGVYKYAGIEAVGQHQAIL